MPGRHWVQWNAHESETLCRAWLAAAAAMPSFWENPAGPAFWALVQEKHHARMGSTNRGQGAIRARFQRYIEKDVKHFHACYVAAAQGRRKRGGAQRDVLKAAHTTFARRFRRRFEYRQCWNILTKHPKFGKLARSTADASSSDEDDADGPALANHMEGTVVPPRVNGNEQHNTQARAPVNAPATATDQAFIDADVGLGGGDDDEDEDDDDDGEDDDDDDDAGTARINPHRKRKARVLDFWKDLTQSYAHIEKRRLKLEEKQLEVAAQRALLDTVILEAQVSDQRIKYAEHLAIARKELREAGVPEQEIELLLPLEILS